MLGSLSGRSEAPPKERQRPRCATGSDDGLSSPGPRATVSRRDRWDVSFRGVGAARAGARRATHTAAQRSPAVLGGAAGPERRRAAVARPADRRAVGGTSPGQRRVGAARPPVQAAGAARRPTGARAGRLRAGARCVRARPVAVRRAGRTGPRRARERRRRCCARRWPCSAASRCATWQSEGIVAQWRRSLEEKRLQAIGLRVDADLAAGAGGRARGRARAARRRPSVRGTSVGTADAGAVRAPGARRMRSRPTSGRAACLPPSSAWSRASRWHGCSSRSSTAIRRCRRRRCRHRRCRRRRRRARCARRPGAVVGEPTSAAQAAACPATPGVALIGRERELDGAERAAGRPRRAAGHAHRPRRRRQDAAAARARPARRERSTPTVRCSSASSS